MTQAELAGGSFTLAEGLTVHRMGYGAMQLAGPHAFGPPADPEGAVAVLREAVRLGIDHIDTSDFYGPHVTNEIIRETLHPYPEGLHLVTKIGARRDEEGGWQPWTPPDALRQAVEENLQRLDLETLDVVNLRLMGDLDPDPDSTLTQGMTALAAMRDEGLVRHLGVSTVTHQQVEIARSIAPVVCVQNLYNLANRDDDELIDHLADEGVAYVPYFPLGGFTPLQSSVLSTVAERVGAAPMNVALAWLLQRSPNILLIPGTSSVDHLRENVSAASLRLSPEDVAELDSIGS